MKAAYWICVALAVISLVFGVFGNNMRWLFGVSVVLVLVAGGLNPKRPFHGLRK